MSFCSSPRFSALLKRAGLLIVLAALSGCEYPTELPLFDVRWVIPIEETSISVVELLPANVDTANGNFELTVAPVSLSQTLGVLCPACIAVDGLTVPKPAFNLLYNQIGNLPTDVVSVDLVSGSISLAIQNNLGFDPINPAPAVTGTFSVTLYDADMSGRQLAQVILDGANLDALPAGLTTVPLTLAPGTISSTIFAEIDVVSPAGDLVLVNVASSFDVTVTVGTLASPILVSSATLDVDGQAVSLTPTQLDVGGIDTDIVNRIQSGSLILDIQNPFGVGVNLSLDISGTGFSTIQRSVNIGTGATSSVTISYSAADFQSFLGQTNVLVSGVGTVVSPGVPATVTPTQEVVIATSLDLTLEVGG